MHKIDRIDDLRAIPSSRIEIKRSMLIVGLIVNIQLRTHPDVGRLTFLTRFNSSPLMARSNTKSTKRQALKHMPVASKPEATHINSYDP
jgi:hypothetical protein